MSLVADALFKTPPPALNVDALAKPYEPMPTTLKLPRKYCPHVPDPGTPQEQFLLDFRRELLYGGAAGGGKSDALLMGALQFVEEPRYAAIIFRKTYTDLSLEGALMERAHEWLGNTDARWNEQKKKWRFPSGASLTFGYLASPLDKFRYQSAEFQYVGFDELTQFPEDDYKYLFSRLRRLAGSRVPLRMRAATNPGGVGHRWVRPRFGITGTPTSMIEVSPDRAFIPAKLKDNRFVDRESYREQLGELDQHTRQQLEEGDWDARMPGPWVLDHRGLDKAFLLGEMYDTGARALPPPVGAALPLGMDFGETSHILVGWPLEGNGMFIAGEYVYRRGEPDTQAKAFWDHVFTKGRFASWPLGRQRFDSSKPESMRLWVRGLRDIGAVGDSDAGKPSPIAFSKYKRMAILHLRKMLELTVADKIGHLAISGAQCPEFREQVYEWQFKNDDTEDVKKENDHGPDGAVSLVAPLARKRRS
jgi:hypothetical protein